jgi:hypothetical protein
MFLDEVDTFHNRFLLFQVYLQNFAGFSAVFPGKYIN